MNTASKIFHSEPLGDLDPTPIKVKDLSGIKQIATGKDHFICLDKKGVVWAMGDDTFGQCG